MGLAVESLSWMHMGIDGSPIAQALQAPFSSSAGSFNLWTFQIFDAHLNVGICMLCDAGWF